MKKGAALNCSFRGECVEPGWFSGHNTIAHESAVSWVLFTNCQKKGSLFRRSFSTHCQSFFWCALDGYQVLRESGTEITHRIGPFQTIPCRCRLRTAIKKGRSHPAPVRRIKGIDPCEGTIPHDAALGSSEKYLDQCHRQSKSVLSDQGSAEAPHRGSDRFHPIDLRLRQIVSASS